jgi:outer membrane protein OmpA-like peptidoglycan-associated protein
MNTNGRLLLCLAAMVLSQQVLPADVFRFAYTKGEKYRVVSQVHESVYVNGKFDHESDILDKIAVEVTDTRADAGFHSALFQTSERAWGSPETYEWSEQYDSAFWRDDRGAYTVDDSQFMPMVRDVPLFPEGDVQPGQSWTARGSEVHDFRANFGISAPFRFPITVGYTFVGRETRDGVSCAVISIDYEIFRMVPPAAGANGMFPTRVAGSSHQKFWWDLAGKRPLADQETFDFVYRFNTGDEVEYTGKAEGHLVAAPPLDRGQLTGEIQKEIDSQHIPGVTVKPSEKGVTITLENVNFPPNSDTLLPSEQDKLRRVGDILRKYPDRDIAVTGYTARAPGYTEKDYQKLSDQRARAAANYLLSIGARRPEQVTARGQGAASPLGDNATEEGRRLNRRVEITILEN